LIFQLIAIAIIIVLTLIHYWLLTPFHYAAIPDIN
jgi:hypothetical protein